MPGWINVPVKIETRNRLEQIKKQGESYDKVINELLDNFKPVAHIDIPEIKERNEIIT